MFVQTPCMSFGWMGRSRALAAAAVVGLVLACHSQRLSPSLGFDHESIVVCGERVAIGTPVVLWTDPGGYSAYNHTPYDGAFFLIVEH